MNELEKKAYETCLTKLAEGNVFNYAENLANAAQTVLQTSLLREAAERNDRERERTKGIPDVPTSVVSTFTGPR